MPGPKGGRPDFVPNPQQQQLVQVMRATGTPIHIIAANLHISEPTLRKHFKQELATGQEQVVAALSASVIRAGLNGDWRAAIAWLARWGPPEWKAPTHGAGDFDARTPLGQAMAMAAAGQAPGADPVQVYLPDNGRPSALDAAQAPPPQLDGLPDAPQPEAPVAPPGAPDAPQGAAPEAPSAPEDEASAA